MAEAYVTDSDSDIAVVRPRTIISVAIVGLVTGLIVWGLSELIIRLIITPVFCTTHSPAFSVCTQGGALGGNIAMVIAAAASLFALVRIHTFRPLLVVLMSVIALWGIGSWVGAFSWYEAMFWSALLFALCYAAFAWLTQIRSFVIALIVCTLVVLAARIIPIL
jgi:hypothetical protein